MKPAFLIVAVVVAALAFGLGMRVGAPDDVHPPVYGEAAALRYSQILKLESPNERAVALGHFFSQANPTDAEALRDVMLAERKYVDAVAEVLFASWLTRFDPERALAARFHPSPAGHHPWVHAVFAQWTRQDPATALEAAIAMPGDVWAGRQEAFLTLARHWLQVPENNPKDLLRPISISYGSPRERASIAEVFLSELIAVRGVDAAETFVNELPPGAVTRELQKRLAVELSKTDPDRAIAWALAQAEKTDHGWGPLVHLAANWGWQDGESALRWATSLPESVYRDRIVERAFRSWLTVGGAEAKGEAARSWIAQQDLTPALEAAYVLYAQNVGRNDPAAGVELAQKLQNEEHRSEALIKIGRGWIEQDREAAMAWMSAANLSAKIQRDIIAGSQFQRKQRERAQKMGASS